MTTDTAPVDREYKLKISISISPALLAKLDRRAEELELPRSTVIQIALREYLAK